MKWYDKYRSSSYLTPYQKVFLDSFTDDEYNELLNKYYYDKILATMVQNKKVHLHETVEWFMEDNRFNLSKGEQQ